MGDSSYRDALSVLEKVLASAQGKKVSLEEVEAATGAPKHALVQSLIKALSEGNADSALAAIQQAAKAEVNMSLYLTLVLERMRLILLVRSAPELRREIQQELGADEYGEAEAIAQAKDSNLTHKTLLAFLDAASRMRFSPIPQLPLELAVLELSSSK
jgi:DNA polymerase-3 subunit gamma/tau